MSAAVILTVWKKELTDHLRDKRTATMIFLLSILMGPIVLFGFTQFISSMEKKAEAKEVYVLGKENAPQLANFFARQDVTIKEPQSDFRDLIKLGRHDPVLVVPKYFAENFQSGSVELELVYDDTRADSGSVSIGVLRRLVSGFNNEVVNQRLIARGISPLAKDPIKLKSVNMGTPAQRAAQLLFMVAFMTLMICVTGSTAIAIDMTAGERERGSMEPLLMTPTSRFALTTGKWLAVGTYGVGAVLLTLAGFALALKYLPMEKLQAVLALSGMQLLGFGVTMLSFAPAMGALQMLIATYGRTYKEAQTYVSYLVMVVSMLPMVVMFAQIKDAMWQLYVPMLGQLMVLTRILRGDPLEAAHFLIPLAINLAISAAAVWALSKLLTKEKIVFGRA